MNKSNAHLYIPLLQAISEGRTIQFKKDANVWEDFNGETNFLFDVDRYRIKPEEKYIPFDDTALFKLFLDGIKIKDKCSNRYFSIVDFEGFNDGEHAGILIDGRWENAKWLLNNCEIPPQKGFPNGSFCGVLVEES